MFIEVPIDIFLAYAKTKMSQKCSYFHFYSMLYVSGVMLLKHKVIAFNFRQYFSYRFMKSIDEFFFSILHWYYGLKWMQTMISSFRWFFSNK